MPTTFGPGPQLAAQCPRVPTPDGWRPWTDTDGPVPDVLAKRSQALVDDPSVPLGATESYPLPGVTVLIRIEPHMWARDAENNLMQGCFRAGGLYLPSTAPAVGSPPMDGWTKAVAVLTVASLAIGTIGTLAAWGRKS